jgi:hypothetical protein
MGDATLSDWCWSLSGRLLPSKLKGRNGSNGEISGIAESSRPARQLRTLSHRWTLDFRSA